VFAVIALVFSMLSFFWRFFWRSERWLVLSGLRLGALWLRWCCVWF
jgi:hypothetical protein